MRLVSFRHVLAALMVMAGTASAQAAELIFAHIGGADSLYEIAVNEYARRVNEKLPSDIKVVAAGNSRHGYDGAVLEKLKRGEVAFGLPSTAMEAVSPKFGIFELPFLIRNRDQARKISDALLEPHLQPEANRKGYRILAVWESGFRQITNNTRAIKRPEDVQGLKVRIPPGQWREKAFRALGAQPVPLEFGKTYEALRGGTLDGQESPLAQVNGSKFYEVQRYLSFSDHLFTPLYVVVSEEHFAKLPQPVQEVLLDEAAKMRDWIYGKSIMLESNLLDDLSEKMQTNQIDLKAFRAASAPVYGEFARTVPGGAKMIGIVAALSGVELEANAGNTAADAVQ